MSIQDNNENANIHRTWWNKPKVTKCIQFITTFINWAVQLGDSSQFAIAAFVYSSFSTHVKINWFIIHLWRSCQIEKWNYFQLSMFSICHFQGGWDYTKCKVWTYFWNKLIKHRKKIRITYANFIQKILCDSSF